MGRIKVLSVVNGPPERFALLNALCESSVIGVVGRLIGTKIFLL